MDVNIKFYFKLLYSQSSTCIYTYKEKNIDSTVYRLNQQFEITKVSTINHKI